MESVFKDLVIVEIASVLAGPSVGMYFAERGAKVIKVENKRNGGDVTRSWKLSTENQDSCHSAYFASVNWNKEHLFLDFKDDHDLKQLHDIISQADIVLTNFKKGGAKKFGLDFESLKKLNSDIIVGVISGYGEESDRVAFDLILQADSGFMSMNGTADSGPVKMPVALIDILAGHQLKEGLLEALLMRAKMKTEAIKISVSLYDAALASLANQATNYLIAKHTPKRIGSKHPNIAPYGELFQTSDQRTITFAIGSDQQFNQLVDLLGVDELKKFESNQSRVQHRTEIEQALQKKVAGWKADDLLSACIERMIPAAIIRNLNEILNDEEVQKLLLEDEIGKRLRTAIYKIES
jgi:crotonobetainyl-CoA:carnitine CoA-transferase CaiB-like acyl-CoA transferase